jgi:C4-dicarboxylate-binding protein DctP
MMRGRWFCSLLASLLLAPCAAEAQQTKLRATVQVAATNPLLGVALVHFKEEVEKRTEKAISVEIFDKGRLYIDDQVVDAVSSGAIEMGVAGFNQFVKKVPAVDIMQQPFLFNFGALVRAATSPDSELRKLIDKAVLEAVGVRVLWWQSFGSTVFFSKGRDVKEPSQIEKQNVRVFSQTMAQLTKLCGGTPVILSSSKMHDALKDGTVDMAMSGIGTVETRELWKVTDTVTRTEHGALEFFVIINEKTWQSLSQSHKTIIEEAARKAERGVREKVLEIETKAYAFAREKGMKIHELTPDQVAEWRACSSGVLEAYMGGTGDLVRQITGAYGKLRTDSCCSSGPTGSFNRR